MLGKESDISAHTDSDKNGKCDICLYLTNKYPSIIIDKKDAIVKIEGIVTTKEVQSNTLLEGAVFGLYAKEFKEIFPNAKIVECAEPTGLSLKKTLEEKDLLNDKKELGKTYINVTKMQDNFKDKTKWFDKPYECLKEIKIK